MTRQGQEFDNTHAPCFKSWGPSDLPNSKSDNIIPSPHKIGMLHCDHWSQLCFGVESHDIAKHLLKFRHFSQNFKPEKHVSSAPSSRPDFWRMLPGLRPQASVVLGVHRGPLWEQKLCSLDLTLGRRLVERRLASGGFPLLPLWLSRGRRMMKVLDSTSSNLFKAKNNHKISQNVLLTILPLMKRYVRTCFSNIQKAGKINVVKSVNEAVDNLFWNRCTKPKKAVVTSHLSCRVHLCCDVLSCFVARYPERNPSYSLLSPELHVPSDGRGKFISNSSLEVRIPKISKNTPTIEKPRFL